MPRPHTDAPVKCPPRFGAPAAATLFAALIIALPATGGGFAGFAEPVAMQVGDSPFYLAAGDVDNDDDPDLVIPNSDTGELTVLLNDGLGAFTEGPTTFLGGYPQGVAVADFDQDGRLDVAVALLDDSMIAVAFGAGDGTFIDTVILLGEPNTRVAAAADFDGDGLPDLAVAAFEEVTVFRSEGDRTFTHLGDHAVGKLAVDMIAADIDGDGAMDLMTGGAFNGDVSILFGDGAGGFAPELRIDPSGFGAVIGVAARDLDHDGVVDLIMSRSSGAISVRLGLGGRRFGPARLFLAEPTRGSIAVEDFDLDGALDVVGADASGMLAGDVLMLRGRGDGSFFTHPDFAPFGQQSPNGLVDGLEVFFVLSHWQQTGSPADANLDGIVDVFDLVAVLSNWGPLTPQHGQRVLFDVAPGRLIATDLDQDGDLDIAAVNTAIGLPNVFILKNTQIDEATK